MNQKLRVSYETMNSSSYMAVICPPEVELVNYELEMMLSNDIKNFLAATRQMLDGNTVIYFNITSRIPLKQVLDKRKLSRKELFRLIEGIHMAVRDAAAYRLPQDGIVLDPEYIYVNPATCAPAFLYLPLRESEGQGVKGMLSDLVLRDRLELSNDNFIQRLLVELNREPFSFEELERNLKQYQIPETGGQPEKTGGRDSQWNNTGTGNQRMMTSPQPEYMQSEYARPEYVQPEYTQPKYVQPEPPQPERPQPNRAIPKLGKSRERNGEAGQDTVSKKAGKRAEKRAKKEKASPDERKKKFLLPQALVMVVFAASISFGLFTDDSGSIIVNNILAFVIVVVLAEVILYREIYVNGKEKKQKKRSASRPATPSGESLQPASSQAAPKRPLPPQSVQQQVVPPQPLPPQQVQQQVVPPQPLQPEPPQPLPPYSIPSHPAMPRQGYVQPAYGRAEETDIEAPTELSDEAEGEASAYLEYYEGGRLSRIPLNASHEVVIGRLERQVDFVVKNPKVGNVHARFYCQNGQFYVVDINSKNGTYINGSRARIESNIPYPLRDRDRIMLADSEFTIRCSEC